MGGRRIPFFVSVAFAGLAVLIGGSGSSLAQDNVAPGSAVPEPVGSTSQSESQEFSSAEYRLLTARIDDLMAQFAAQERVIEEHQRTIASRLTEPRVQSGVIFVTDAEAVESGLWRLGGSCDDVQRTFSGRLDFEQAFAFVPEVLVALTQVDMATGGQTAVLRMVVTGTDAGGFNYQVSTWCSSSVARVRAEWIAVAR